MVAGSERANELSRAFFSRIYQYFWEGSSELLNGNPESPFMSWLNEQGGAIIPVFKDWLDAHNQKVGGHTPHGGFDMDNGYIMQKAWLKA